MYINNCFSTHRVDHAESSQRLALLVSWLEEAIKQDKKVFAEKSFFKEFQQAYQASSRILQTARELFQTLIEVV